MKNQLIAAIFTIIILTMPSILAATPSGGGMVRVILLGSSDNAYYCLMVSRHNPGSHYEYSDSTYLVEYDLQTHQPRQSHLIRATKYQDVDTQGNWQRFEQVASPPVDVAQLLQAKGVKMALPSAYAADLTFEIDRRSGLSLDDNHRQPLQLLDGKVLQRYFPQDTGEPLKIISVLGTTTHLFLLAQEGTFCCMEGTHRQVIIPLSKKMLNEKRR